MIEPIKRARITSLSIKVFYGRYKRPVTLISLADKFGKPRKAMYERWLQIGRPGRVYAWLFESTAKWSERTKELGVTGVNNPRCSRPSFAPTRAIKRARALERDLFPNVGSKCPAYIPER